MQKNTITSRLVIMAFLIALEIIFTRFLSINLPIVRIGFGFLPVAIAAIMFGPLWAGIGYVIGDILGMLIFPNGAYFPGFTLTAFLTGITYGLFLHNSSVSLKRTILTVVTVIIFYTVVLNSIWLNILYGQGFIAILPTRLLQAAIMIPVQVFLIQFVWKRIVSRIPVIAETI